MTTVRVMSQGEIYHILFVCIGNICRSPSAENVMRKVVDAAGLSRRFQLDSAGTISLHCGNPPDPRMSRALKNRGFAAVGKARQVTMADFETFDLILAMDDENLRNLRDLEKRVSTPRATLRLFCAYCRESAASNVPDPYYGGSDGFERVLDLLEDGCAGLLENWNSGQLPGQ